MKLKVITKDGVTHTFNNSNIASIVLEAKRAMITKSTESESAYLIVFGNSKNGTGTSGDSMVIEDDIRQPKSLVETSSFSPSGKFITTVIIDQCISRLNKKISELPAGTKTFISEYEPTMGEKCYKHEVNGIQYLVRDFGDMIEVSIDY